MPYIIKARFVSMFVKQQGSGYMATPKPGDLTELRELIEAGKISPVVDKTYPLSEISDAFRHLNEGHAGGKVVVRVCE